MLGLFLVVCLRIHNAWVYPPYWGLDANGHAQCVEILCREGRLPIPQEGWSAYHPPLYYVLSSLPTRLLGWPDPLLCAKLLSMLSSFTLMTASFFCIRRVYPQRALLGTLLLGAFPNDILYSCACYNMELEAALCALWILLEMETREKPWLLRWTSLGCLGGLIVLCRPEGLIAYGWLAWVALLDLRRGQRKSALGSAWAVSLTALLSLWFQFRNLALYGRLLISNYDSEMLPWSAADASLGFSWPGFLSIWSWILPDFSLWAQTRYPSGSASMLSMLLASASVDYSNVLRVPVNLTVDRIFLVFTVFATAGIVWGAFQPSQDKTWHGLALMVLAPYVFLNLHIPSTATAKAIYMAPAYIPLLYFLITALEALALRWPRLGARLGEIWLILAALGTWRFWAVSGL